MQPIKHISIPTPCHEQWQNMDEVQQGRFCHSCAKTVVDFSAMTDQQVINYLSTAHNVCGRIDPVKMNQINRKLYVENLEPVGWWKKLGLAFAMLSLVPLFKLQAQSKPAQHQVDTITSTNQAMILGKVLLPPKLHTITGRIIDKNNQPIPGSTVSVHDNKNIKAIANLNGEFVLNVPDGEKMIDVSNVGYFTQSFNIGNNRNYTIKLEEAWLGEIAVVKQPLPKRILNKCVKMVKKKSSR